MRLYTVSAGSSDVDWTLPSLQPSASFEATVQKSDAGAGRVSVKTSAGTLIATLATQGEGVVLSWTGVAFKVVSHLTAIAAAAMSSDASPFSPDGLTVQWQAVPLRTQLHVPAFGNAGDAARLNQAILDTANYGGASVRPGKGTMQIDSAITQKSGVMIEGYGDASVLAPSSSLALTSALIQNEHTSVSVANTRTDNKMRVRSVRIDGSGRTYPVYLTDPATGLPITSPATNSTRNPAYTTSGYLIRYVNSDDAVVEDCYLHDHGSYGLVFQGCKNAYSRFNRFERTGRIDYTSPALGFLITGGSRQIVAGTAGSPTVFETLSAHGFSTGQQAYIRGVGGFDGLVPDGLYTITNLTSTTFSVAVNTTGASAFVLDGNAFMGDTYLTRTEHCGSYGDVFRDLNRMAINASADYLDIIGLDSRNSKEGCIYLSQGRFIQIVAPQIERVALADLVAQGLEINACAHLNIRGGLIRKADSTAASAIGCIDLDVDGLLIDTPAYTSGLTYPYGPFSEGAGKSGAAVDSSVRNGWQLDPMGKFPLTAKIGGKVIDSRAVPLGQSALALSNSGGSSGGADNVRVQNLDVTEFGNVRQVTGITNAAAAVVTTDKAHGRKTGDLVYFTRLKSPMGILNGNSYACTVLSTTTFSIPVDTTATGAFVYDQSGRVGNVDPSKVISTPATVADATHLRIKDNPGHPSETPVTLETSVTATGTLTLDFGFPPSEIRIEAFQTGTGNIREGASLIERSRYSQAAANTGRGRYKALDGVGGSLTLKQGVYADAASRLYDATLTQQFTARVLAWTDVGVQLNILAAVGTIELILTAYP